MITRVLFAAAISTLALAACSSDVQGPSGGGTPGAGGSSSGHSSGTSGASGGSSSGTTSGGTSSGASGTTSGGSSSGGSSSGNPVNTETWADGKTITANVDIVKGATVTVAPGAKITVSAGVTITVHGALTAAAKASHAKLTGTGWTGIVVATGGSMTLAGVDLENSTSGIHVNGNNVAAEYDYGTMTGGMFTVDVGGTFKTDHAAVVKGGSSAVNGAFTATFLNYAGTDLGMADPSATVFVADSKITGPGGDFFVPSAGKLLHVEYSTVDSTHCPFHFSGIAKFEIDHVTTGGTGGTSTSGYGLMIYNADTGPHSIKNSNFNDPSWHQTDPGPTIAVDHSYIKYVGDSTTNPPTPGTKGQVTITNAQSSMAGNPDAHPRGTPGPG